jgi:hypothetical protein
VHLVRGDQLRREVVGRVGDDGDGHEARTLPASGAAPMLRTRPGLQDPPPPHDRQC